MDYYAVLAVLGIAVLGAAVLPGPLRPLPVSMPMLAVGVGMALFALPFGLEGPRPGSDDVVAERLTELAVIVSLTGAGLKLRRRIGWRRWNTTWRLLAITMPITVVAVSVLGVVALGFPVAAAILLGGVIAPTDPVLASEVQLAGPGDAQNPEESADGSGPTQSERADDSVRFALTSEAGLNDGLAFPVTNLAIAMAVGGSWFARWTIDDVVIKIAIGVIAGLVFGRLIAHLTFGRTSSFAFARSGDGLVAFGFTLAVYGLTELLHGYGFLAVFIAAVTLRQRETTHEFHRTLHDFADTLERIASLLFLLLLGGAAVDGALAGLTAAGAAVAVAIIFVVRPVGGLLALVGSDLDRPARLAISFFGIRGMGSIYYLAHAVNEEYFPAARQIWAVAVLTILISILVHGMSAGPVLAWMDGSMNRSDRPQSTDVSN